VGKASCLRQGLRPRRLKVHWLRRAARALSPDAMVQRHLTDSRDVIQLVGLRGMPPCAAPAPCSSEPPATPHPTIARHRTPDPTGLRSSPAGSQSAVCASLPHLRLRRRRLAGAGTEREARGGETHVIVLVVRDGCGCRGGRAGQPRRGGRAELRQRVFRRPGAHMWLAASELSSSTCRHSPARVEAIFWQIVLTRMRPKGAGVSFGTWRACAGMHAQKSGSRFGADRADSPNEPRLLAVPLTRRRKPAFHVHMLHEKEQCRAVGPCNMLLARRRLRAPCFGGLRRLILLRRGGDPCQQRSQLRILLHRWAVEQQSTSASPQ